MVLCNSCVVAIGLLLWKDGVDVINILMCYALLPKLEVILFAKWLVATWTDQVAKTLKDS